MKEHFVLDWVSGITGAPDHLHQPLALGCCPLGECSSASSWAERETPPQGRALAQPF
jgi:hypothetical protein